MTFEFSQRSCRPYRPADEHEVLALINEDRLAGQPACTWSMLEAARVGRSAFEAAGWARLDPVRTDVVVDEESVVLGAVSTGIRRPDGTGVLLWLHGGEEPAVVHLLLDAAVRHLAGRTISAFPLLSPLGLGLRGIPARHRAVTLSAMRGRAFETTGSSIYLHRHLAGPVSRRVAERVRPAHDAGLLSWRIHRAGTDAHLDVSVRPDGPGWITQTGPDPHADEAADLVVSAVRLLNRYAARDAIATVPVTGSGARGVREALWRLGFTEIDQLAVLDRKAPVAESPGVPERAESAVAIRQGSL